MKKVFFLIWITINVCFITEAFSYNHTEPDNNNNTEYNIQLYLKEDRQAHKLLSTYKDNLPYNQVCWLTSHNSFAYKDPSFKHPKFPNQKLDINSQLKYGVRSFMIDLWYPGPGKVEKEIIIAHSNDRDGQRLFAQPFLPFLQTMQDWLDSHKEDIVTVHLESWIGDYQKIYSVLGTAKLQNLLFDLCEYHGGKTIQKKGSSACSLPTGKELDPGQLQWPTLGELRNTGKRLIIFSDSGEDIGPGIMHTKEYMETQYDLISYPDCEMRPDNRTIGANLFVMNHFYPVRILGMNFGADFPYISKKLMVTTPNSYEEVYARMCTCFTQYKQIPNFIAMDFIGTGKADEREIIIAINNGSIVLPCSRQLAKNESVISVFAPYFVAICGGAALTSYCALKTWRRFHVHDKLP